MGRANLQDCISMSVQRWLVLMLRGIGRFQNTVFKREHKTESTTCLSEQVQIYVRALMPRCGRTPEVMYILWPARVKRSRKISDRLASYSFVVATAVLQPTPLCHIAYETLDCPSGCGGIVKSEKNKRSTRVSISSSASGFTSSNSSDSGFGPSLSTCDSSNRTSFAMAALRVRFLLVAQKNCASQAPKLSFSYKNGSIRVRTLMQFKASLEGANSGSGKEGWCRRLNRRDVAASMSVSRFSKALSRVRRMSAGAKRPNMSPDDSGSSQNWYRVSEAHHQPSQRRLQTEVQYGSSAGMCRSSDSLKMPRLKTILESLAPMSAVRGSSPSEGEKSAKLLCLVPGSRRREDGCPTLDYVHGYMESWQDSDDPQLPVWPVC